MNIAKWTGGQYPIPQNWPYKKDMPQHLRHEAKRVSFGLFGVGWIAVDLNGAALLKDGRRLPLFEFWLRTPGHVIGPRDMQVAAHKEWAMEWQTACADRMKELCDLQMNQIRA